MNHVPKIQNLDPNRDPKRMPIASFGRIYDVPADKPVDELKPWDRLDGEDPEWHLRFLYYMNLGSKRTYQKAYTKYCYDEHIYLPGEPIPATGFTRWRDYGYGHQWLPRAKLWDAHLLREFQDTLEEKWQARFEKMADEHIAGYELFQQMAIQSIVEVDTDGNVRYAKDGRPVVKKVDSPVDAMRIFEKTVKGKRIEMGLPTEYMMLSPVELNRQIQENERVLLESETVDAEVRELEDDDA